MSFYKKIFKVCLVASLFLVPSEQSAQTAAPKDCRNVKVTKIVKGKKVVTWRCVSKKGSLVKKTAKTSTKLKPKTTPKHNLRRDIVRNRTVVNSGSSQRRNVDVQKALIVDSKVIVEFCVANAVVKVNGWKRNEVRAFVTGNEKISFNVRGVNKKSKKPSKIELWGDGKFNSCLAGKSIELDVPFDAEVSIKATSGETSARVDSVRRSNVKIVSGDIAISNVSDGVKAYTNVGGITARNCGGNVDLVTTAGNIVAYKTIGNEIGDILRARTHSGTITLQSIEQQEVDVSSVSGFINYVGPVQEYGKYSFKTTSGLITMAIPLSSSFNITAAYGGSFSSELSLTNIEKNARFSTVYLTGRVGKESGTTVSLNSYNGTIRMINLEGPPQ